MWEQGIEVSLVYLLIYGLFNTSIGIFDCMLSDQLLLNSHFYYIY